MAGLKDRTLGSGGQAKLVPAPRGSRGDEGKDSGILGTVCSLADKAGFCCQKQGQKESWHWSGLQGWGRSAPLRLHRCESLSLRGPDHRISPSAQGRAKWPQLGVWKVVSGEPVVPELLPMCTISAGMHWFTPDSNFVYWEKQHCGPPFPKENVVLQMILQFTSMSAC